MDFELKGKIALVTGASAGIGREIAKVLASEGANTIVLARRTPLLESLADEIEMAGGPRPHIISADLSERIAVARVLEEVMGKYGYIDILVNNAGGSRPTALNASDDIWDESFAINFTAVRKMTAAFLPCMQQRKFGRIINVTGSAEPARMNAANAAKAGVHAWAKGLSREVGRDGITVNSFQPGRIHSEQIDNRLHPSREEQERYAQANIPLGHFGDPCDIAYLVAFFCSSKAHYITGQRIYVDGGMARAI